MAKEKEKKVARILYVDQGKDAKEISGMVNVSEATLSKWVNQFGWKQARSARVANPSNRTNNIKQIINDLSEQRIELGRQLKQAESDSDIERCTELRTIIAKVDDAVSKWNKTLENVDKENQVTLSTYLNVMDMVFEALRKEDIKLYMKTLDFQERHLNDVSLTFK
jgi:transposase